MEFLSDDPTYLAGGLGALAGVFLIASRVTQQGKYLIWSAVALASALAVVGLERVWVTDNERIEQTVYDLGRAVVARDAPGVLGRLTPDVQYVVGGNSTPSPATRKMIEQAVTRSTFDFLRITHLQASAGGQARRGRAEFRVLCSGSFHGAFTLNFGSANSTWSLGLREVSPGVWKVNRITPVSLPGNQNVLPSAYFEAPGPGPDPSEMPQPYRWGRGRGRRSAASLLDIPAPAPAPWEP